MAPGSREQKIIDITHYLPATSPAPPSGGNGKSFDFIDVVDDSPAEPPASEPRPRRGLSETWRVFVWMLMTGAVLGTFFAPVVFLMARHLGPDNILPVGLVLVTACLLTAYLNYRIVRILAARLLSRLENLTREGFDVAIPPPQLSLQAREIDRLEQTLSDVLNGVRHQNQKQKRLERNDLVATITALATALEARDPYTRNHSRSVARLTVRLGRRLGLPDEALYELHLAGLLHDIGKIGVPDEILLKPTRLTPEEMKIVQAHVEWSYNILAPITMLGQVATIVRHHHERFDGLGYPDRLAGQEIPQGARIMASVDMYMAMTEDRPYRKGLPVEVAVDELKRVSGTQLDPECVRGFLDLLESDGVIQPLVASSNRAAAN